MNSLITAFGILGRDERVKCIVVTGHGHSFCVGADLDVGFGGGQAGRSLGSGLGKEGDGYTKENKDGGDKWNFAP